MVDLGLRWSRRAWRRCSDLGLAAMDGYGEQRVYLGFTYEEPDLGLSELPELARLLDQLFTAVPDCECFVSDPMGLFGRWDDRFVVGQPEAEWLRPLPDGWALPEDARLAAPPELTAAPMPILPVPPHGDGELFDLLEAIERVGPQPNLIRAGAGVALRHLVRLHAFASSGVLAAASCELLANLAERELADLSDVIPTAQRLVNSGDTREREAGRRLLTALDTSGVVGRTDPEGAWAADAMPLPDWILVEEIGRRLLETPGFRYASDVASEGAHDWEDDLELDDLLLVVDEAVDLPDTPVSRALRRLRSDPDLEAARSLALMPAFPNHALDLLHGSDEATTGAALLLAEGLWPARRIPRAVDALARLARSSRPTGIRALATRALARVPRPDTGPLLTLLADDPIPEVAGEAIRGLARVPGARARRMVRSLALVPALAVHAIAGLAEAADPGGFSALESLATAPDVEVRQAVARHLDAIGGWRAQGPLTRMLMEDPAWEVRLEAAASLARLEVLERLLHDPDPDLRCRVLRSVGLGGRADAFGQLVQATFHEEAAIREAAAEALGGVGLVAATPILLALLDDRVLSVAVAAASALGHCGDRRAVDPLRRVGARRDDLGVEARKVLRHGRCLRLPPPSAGVEIKARSTEVLDAARRSALQRTFQGTGLAMEISDREIAGTLAVQPQDGATLRLVVEALDRADAQVPGLTWSVRDGQAAIRRHHGAWILSGRKGEIVRDAGWFSLPQPEATDRPPLIALPRGAASSEQPGALPIQAGASSFAAPPIPSAATLPEASLQLEPAFEEVEGGTMPHGGASPFADIGDAAVPSAALMQEEADPDGAELTLGGYLEEVEAEDEASEEVTWAGRPA